MPQRLKQIEKMFKSEINAFESKIYQLYEQGNKLLINFFKEKDGYREHLGRLEKSYYDEDSNAKDGIEWEIVSINYSLDFFSKEVTPEVFAEILTLRAGKEALLSAISKIKSVMKG